jgi:hypothetical protein
MILKTNKMFADLSPYALLSFLTEWIALAETVELNTAFCNKKSREKLVYVLEIHKETFPVNDELNSPEFIGLSIISSLKREHLERVGIKMRKYYGKENLLKQFDIMTKLEKTSFFDQIACIDKLISISIFKQPPLHGLTEEKSDILFQFPLEILDPKINTSRCCLIGFFISKGAIGSLEYNGTFNGFCAYYNVKDFSSFVGTFVNNKKDGFGEQLHENGNKYSGNWKDNFHNGEGEMIYKNGDIYTGNWSNNFRSGYGQMIYANGDVYRGKWEYGKPKLGKE